LHDVYGFMAARRLSVCNAMPTSGGAKALLGMSPLPLRRALAVCWQAPPAVSAAAVPDSLV
jgi:hypothetical protein